MERSSSVFRVNPRAIHKIERRVQHEQLTDTSLRDYYRLFSGRFRLAATFRAGIRGAGIDMALPKGLQPTLTPDELSFLAEEDVIDIVPLFSMTRVRLLGVSLVQCIVHLPRLNQSRVSTDPSSLLQLVQSLYGWPCH